MEYHCVIRDQYELADIFRRDNVVPVANGRPRDPELPQRRGGNRGRGRPHKGFSRHGAKTIGNFWVDLVRYEAVLDGRGLALTPKEFGFLAYLARNAGKVCTRRMILESVWGPQYADETHYLKVHPYRIRRKPRDEDGRFLQSDPSVGCRLIPSGD